MKQNLQESEVQQGGRSPPVLSANKLWFGQESGFFQWEMHEYLAEVFEEVEKILSDMYCQTCPDAQAVVNLS